MKDRANRIRQANDNLVWETDEYESFVCFKIAKQNLETAKTRVIKPPSCNDNSFWCLLACLNRYKIMVPKDVKMMFHEYYLHAKYRDSYHLKMLRMIVQFKNRSRTPSCLFKDCSVLVPMETFSISLCSILLYEEWLAEHLQKVHRSNLNDYRSYFGNCEHNPSDHVKHTEYSGYMWDESEVTEYCKKCSVVLKKKTSEYFEYF